MGATTLTLIGCAFGLIALLVALSQLHPTAIGREPWELPPPWAPWSATTGSGSGSAHESRRKPAPADPTPPLMIHDIMARRPTILRWLRERGIRPADLEDVAEAVIEGAWNSRASWRPERCRLDTFLWAVARNHANNHRRKAYTRRVVLVDPTADPGIAASPFTDETPERALHRAELVRRAWAILARIPPRLADVWTRYEIDGEQVRGIADETGIPFWTVWGRIQLARVHVAREVAREQALETRARRPRRQA